LPVADEARPTLLPRADTRHRFVLVTSQVFYAEQHAKQTLEFNLKAREKFHSETRARMTIWEAIEKLDTLIDESDPDTSLSQIQHLLQTAEAMRRDGKPDWMQLTGLVHDLGKLLCFYGAEGQWDVVGDTFVVGCKFSEKIIYPATCKC
jgi:inositol oxygenase